jgi:type I restriction enzyme M protein
MSEELGQKGLTEHGLPLGSYEFYNIGSTTLRALKQYNIIPNKDYGELEFKRPDALLVDRRNLRDVRVVVTIEFKEPTKFNTEEKKRKAFEECVTYCKILDSKIGIATDLQEYHWLNPQPGYETTNGNDKYEIIIREDGYPLRNPFVYSDHFEINETLKIIKKILDSITETNSMLKPIITQNPSQLADRLSDFLD